MINLKLSSFKIKRALFIENLSQLFFVFKEDRKGKDLLNEFIISSQQMFLELCIYGTILGIVEFNNKWDLSPTIQGAYPSVKR